MSPAELQAMQEAIKAIGASCADLSKIVEGLPKFVTEQIGAYKAEISVQITALGERLSNELHASKEVMQSLQADHAKLEGVVSLQVGSLSERLAEVPGLIAGKADALQTQIEGLTARMVEAEAGLGTLKFALPQQVGEVNARVDKAAAAIEEVSTQVTEHVVALGKRVDDGLTKLEARAVQLVEDAERRIGTDLKAMEQSHSDAIAAGAQSALTQHAKLGELEQRVDEQEKATTALVNGRVQALEILVSKQIGETRDAIMLDVTERTSNLQVALSDHEERLGQVEVRVAQVDEDYSKKHDATQDRIAAVEDEQVRLKAVDGEQEKLLGKVGTELNELRVSVVEDISKVATEARTFTEQGLAAVHASLATMGESMLQKIDGVFTNGKDVTNELAGRIDKLEDNIKGVATKAGTDMLEVKQSVLGQGRTLADLGKSVEGITATVDSSQHLLMNVQADLGATKTVLANTVDNLASVHAEVEKKADKEHVQSQVKDVRGYVDVSFAKALEHTDQRATAWKADLRAYANNTADLIESHRKATMESVSAVIVSVDDLRNELKADREASAEQVRSLAENFLKVETRMVATADTQAERLSRFADEAEQRAVRLVQVAAEELRADLQALREAVPTPEAVATIETRLSARLGALADAVATLRDAVGTWDPLTAPLAQRTADLAERLDEVHAMATNLGLDLMKTEKKLVEVDDRLVNLKMPEPVVELPSPKLDISTSYDEGKIRLRITNGDQFAETEVPVNIGVRYGGVWKSGADCQPGDLWTHKGSVWFCKSPKAGEPGKDFTGWQLAVKAGAPGKDGHSVKVYTSHHEKNVYREGDFLRLNNRLWQCAVDETRAVPEPSDITTTPEWVLLTGAY